MIGALLTARTSWKGFVADVGDVDHHAEAIHFGDDLLAEGAEAVVGGLVGGGVGPFAVAAVGERHVADAVGGKFSQDAEVAVDHVAAFDGEQDGDFLLRAGGADSVGGGGEGEIVGVLVDLRVDGVDLFLRALDGDRTADFAGHPDGEEYGADAAFFHARNVYASLFVARGEIEVAVDEALGGVGVSVDDDAGEMELAGFGRDVGLRGLAGHWFGAEEKE